MNWGYRLTLLFAGFAALIMTLVYKATHTKYELVSKDYYSDELRYQEKIDGRNNAAQAGAITLVTNGRFIEIALPQSLQQPDSASVWLYCPTNASHDRRIPLHFLNGSASIDKTQLAADNYELRLQLTVSRQPYYYTQPLDLR